VSGWYGGTDDDWGRKSEEIRRATQARVNAFGREALVAEVSAILSKADPVDEYDGEAQTIVLRLNEARCPEDVQRIAHEQFVSWFDASDAGPPERYGKIGHGIWAATNREAHP